MGPGEFEALAQLRGPVARGRHLALVAAEGGCVEAVYAAAVVSDLGLADGAEADFADQDAADSAGAGLDSRSIRAVVLAATDDRAWRCARGMRAAMDENLRDRCPVVVMPGDMPSPAAMAGASVAVGTPVTVLEALTSGRISGSEVRSLVMDNIAALDPAWPAVDALLQSTGRDIRRVATGPRYDERFGDLMKRWLPRARRWPLELFEPAPAPADSPAGPFLRTLVRASGRGRVSGFAGMVGRLSAAGKEVSVVVASAPRAFEVVSSTLAAAGFGGISVAPLTDAPMPAPTGAEDDVGAAADDNGAPAADEGGAARAVVLYGLPRSAEALARALGEAGQRYAVVDVIHMQQLEIMARQLGWRVAPLGDGPVPEFSSGVEEFRNRIRDAVRSEDLATGALLLEPVLAEYGAARVAAAMASLLRGTDIRGAGGDGPPDRSRSAKTGRDRQPGEGQANRAARTGWQTVFVNVGERDGLGPGDVVGAITGETDVKAAQIGRIQIKPGFALVQVNAGVLEEVVAGLNGTMLRGKEVMARPDRGPSTSRPSGPGRPSRSPPRQRRDKPRNRR
ncbi:MAG: DbpA RNA binding domain-containing protein [Gemmatimonadetes bacterium]|nr:DbpA RNA binding domain-containing protein [Gemmatimonadota bacterium]